MRIGWIVLAALGWALTAPASAAPCETQVFDDDQFTVCRFDSRHQEMRLVWTDANRVAVRSFSRLSRILGGDSGRVRFAMNAGMFEDNGMPLGLYVERGVVRRPLNTRSGGGNFYLKPNGVFLLRRDGTVRVETSEAVTAEPAPPLFATQSGPMLVIDGEFNANIAADGPSRNIRNGVGVRDGHTALFVISEDAVSFGRLARFFRDGLKCRDALYLDGSISSLWVPSEPRQVGGFDLGPMIVVLDKP